MQHAVQRDEHEVEQMVLVHHAARQLLGTQQLHAHVHHAVRDGLSVRRVHQRHGDAAVVLDEGARKVLLKCTTGSVFSDATISVSAAEAHLKIEMSFRWNHSPCTADWAEC